MRIELSQNELSIVHEALIEYYFKIKDNKNSSRLPEIKELKEAFKVWKNAGLKGR